MGRIRLGLLGAFGMWVLCWLPSASGQAMRTSTDWFQQARWGVMTHYLGAPPSSSGGAELTAEAWNRQVDAFDAGGLADQVASTGAKYLLLTIGQNSGHYCSPNATYDKLVGIRPSKCSRRDLVADVAKALKAKGIRLLVYLPSGAPAADPVARKKLGWRWGSPGAWQLPGEPVGGRLAEFQRKWEAVIREWSLRWGKEVSGWWIDGCYFADQMYRFADEPNFASFAAALKAGNPEAIVAFNPGVRIPVAAHTGHEDYSAGEVDLPQFARAVATCRGRWLECEGALVQFHILTFLGTTWCGGDRPQWPNEKIVALTRQIADQGGVVTFDVPIQKNGRIPQPFIEQLRAIGRAMPAAPAGRGDKASLVPPVFLPDGQEFKTWEMPQAFSKTYYVSQAHSNASDDNPGSQDRPWRSIGRAAQMLRPGERVVVAAGVYRERVRPARGGSSPEKMISYEAAPGAEVVVSGSRPVASMWSLSNRGTPGRPQRVWMTTLPQEFFARENPFKEVNLTDAQIDRSMDWAVPTKGKVPNTLRRGLVFQDGKRLKQVARFEELSQGDGRYWVEEDGRTLHVRPLGGIDPAQAKFEATVQGFIFAPDAFGLGYIRVKGLTIEHAGNCFPRPQQGALSTMRGHHWIIEDCTLRQCNSIGIDIGDQFDTAKRNRIVNNIFVDHARPLAISDPENHSDYNVFDTSRAFDLAKWQKGHGWDAHSTAVRLTVQLDLKSLTLDWSANGPRMVLRFPVCPIEPRVGFDFFGEPRAGATTRPGPFVAFLDRPVSLRTSPGR